MVSLKLRMGPKGQVVIPKMLRERYGMREGGEVLVELREDGILLRAKPSPDEIITRIMKFREIVRKMGIRGKPGELKGLGLEDEF